VGKANAPDVEDAKREIADIGRGRSGHIRVGIVPTAARFLLPPVRRAVCARDENGGLAAHSFSLSFRTKTIRGFEDPQSAEARIFRSEALSHLLALTGSDFRFPP
jgi:hypothetical protein